MKIETLNRSHLKRNIIIAVIVIAIISAIILTFTRAKYRSYSVPLINGTINYSAADLNIVAITVDGEEADTIPTGNYELTEESYCEVNGNRDDNISLSYDNDTQTLNVVPFTTKGAKCYLDFKELPSYTMQEIITRYNIGNRGSFSTPYTSTTTNTVFTTTDWKGTSYYFAGNPTDNWVQFAGFYWRIVRVNGDGSVRLIYNGTSTTTTGTETMINSNQAFNSSYNRSEYVGFKYTTGEQHGLTTDSTILNTLQSWYNSSGLSATQYSRYIDTSIGFCNDRNMTSGSLWRSTGSTHYYAARERVYTNKNPNLACSNIDIIAEPIGLITVDEVAFAGGVFGVNNTNYYLHNNQYYLTMSPSYFNASSNIAFVFMITSNGYFGYGNVDSEDGVRPVINLKYDTKFTGTGTTSDPYVVIS